MSCDNSDCGCRTQPVGKASNPSALQMIRTRLVTELEGLQAIYEKVSDSLSDMEDELAHLDNQRNRLEGAVSELENALAAIEAALENE